MFGTLNLPSDSNEELPEALRMFGLSELALGVAEGNMEEGPPNLIAEQPVRQKRGPPVEPVVCSVCQKRFTRKAHLTRHMLLHTGNTPFKCHLCPQSFNRKDHLRGHLKAHGANKPYKCLECSCSYSSNDQLRVHVLKSHGKYLKIRRISETTNDEWEGDANGGQKLSFKVLTCRECNMAFSEIQAFINHVAQHTTEDNASDPQPQEEVLDGDDSDQLVVDTGGEEEEAGPSIPEQQPQSESVDHGLPEAPKNIACVVCGKDSFPNQRALRRHYKQHKRKYICRFCGQRMASAGSLMRHNMLHTGEKPFACDKCGRRFSRKDALKSHLISHEKNQAREEQPKPFHCTECPASFTMRYNLIRHMQRSHQHQVRQRRKRAVAVAPPPVIDPEMPVLLPQLPMPSFPEVVEQEEQRPELEAYMGQEAVPANPLQCNHCGKVFATMKSLSTHVWYHNQERKFVCPVCQRGFKYATDLNRHVLTHTSNNSSGIVEQIQQQPLQRVQRQVTRRRHRAPANHNTILINGLRKYPCEYCVVIFNHRSNRSRHVRIFHADKLPPEQRQTLQLQRPSLPVKKRVRRACVSLPFHKRRAQPMSRNQVDLEENEAVELVRAQQRQIREARQSIESNENKIEEEVEPDGNGLYRCHLCEKVFSKKYNYKLHLRTHNKLFACVVCGLKTASQGDLTLHIRTHTGEKPFQCAYPSCQWKFARRSALTIHYRRHHGQNGKLKQFDNPEPEPLNGSSTTSLEDRSTSSILKELLADYPWESELPKKKEDQEEEKKVEEAPIVNPKKNLPPPPPLVPYPLPTPVTTNPNPDVMFWCKPCGRMITGKESYVDHMLVTHGHTVTAIDSVPVTRRKLPPLSKLRMAPLALVGGPKQEQNQTSSFNCRCCGDVFGSRYELTVHTLVIHSPGNRTVSCGICRKHCSTIGFLSRHYQYCHPEDKNAAEEARAILTAKSVQQNQGKVECERNVVEEVGGVAELLCPEVLITEEGEDEKQDEQVNEVSTSSSAPRTLPALLPIYPTGGRTEDPVYPDNPYPCPECHKCFKDKKALSDHKWYHSLNPIPCSVPGCERRFKLKNDLIRHMRRHLQERPYACPEPSCEVRFYQNSDLERHLHRMHNNSNKIQESCYDCQYCDARFAQSNLLVDHVKSCHPEQDVSNLMLVQTLDQKRQEDELQMREFLANLPPEEEEIETAAAVDVNEIEPNAGFIQNLLEILDDGADEEAPQSQDPPKEEEDPNSGSPIDSLLPPCVDLLEQYTNEQGELLCQACNKYFKDLKTLQNHLYYHTRVSKHRCEECGAKFKQKSDLRRHMQTNHDPENQRECIRCPKCNRSFTKDRYLKMHLNNCGGDNDLEEFLENGEIPEPEMESTQAKEEEEEKELDLEQLLRDIDEEYRQTQQQQPMFLECDLCDARFVRSNELILHKRNDHANMPRDNSLSPIAPGFLWKGGRGGRSFICDKCGISFLQRGELTQHLQQHHLHELPIHQCQFCPKYFYVKKSLQTHCRRHHAHLLNLTACEICGMKFQAREYLISHLKSHHQLG